MTKEKYSQLKILDILRWLLDFVCDQTRRNFRVISSVALHSAATAAFLLLLRELEPESENCAQMLSGGELQGGTAWLTAGVAGWWWLRVVLCRGAPACVDWDWVLEKRERRARQHVVVWLVCLLCTMGNFALGPGLANVLGKDNINYM